MKTVHWIIAVAALSFVQPSQAAQTDSEVIIYRFPGVRDNGGAAGSGTATSFHCTNFSGVLENIRFVTRDFDGFLRSNSTLAVPHLSTLTASTHATMAYAEGLILTTAIVQQGTTAIAATSINIICTAVTIDASAAVPTGVALRGIRFNPIPGSQE